MANGIGPVDQGQALAAMRRAQLEAKVGEAIARAQKQYMQVQLPKSEAAPVNNGPEHLGKKIDIRV